MKPTAQAVGDSPDKEQAPKGRKTHFVGKHRLKRLPRIQQDRNRTLIHQLHLHHFLKAPGLAPQPRSAQSFDKEFVNRSCTIRRRCPIKRRTLPPPHISIQSELRNGQHAPARVLTFRFILPRRIFKHAQDRQTSRRGKSHPPHHRRDRRPTAPAVPARSRPRPCRSP